MTQPAKIEQVRSGDNPWFEVTLTEGRNRQLRKMFEEVGHHVEKIRRIGYGALVLDVPPGGFRELTPGEVQALNRAAAGRPVERKKTLPEAAQLKKPVPPKRAGARARGSGSKARESGSRARGAGSRVRGAGAKGRRG
jgi:23S rRNA pseudouridine2605 synthase